MKIILKNSFYQLLAIYTILIALITLGFLSKYTLQFHLLSIIIAILGVITIKEKQLKYKFHTPLFILSILLILITRLIPYLNNKIPLGYDSGIYKYGIESGLKNLDNWILQGGLEPGFLYLMEVFKLFFSSDFILKYILILFCVLLGISIYLVSKTYFNKTTGLLAILIYSLSIIQLLTFQYMYYKNIIALSLILLSIYFLEKKQVIPFIILASISGGIHRPTFYIFGLSYLFYTFISPIKNKYDFKLLKRNIIQGLSILILTSLFYLGKFSKAILIIINPVIQGFSQPGESPGTFINFFQYQYSVLIYLPFALLGLFYLIKNKKFNIITIWSILSLIIVYFQFFFYNRFIIMLDISLIILASYGFYLISQKKLGVIITILLLVFSSILIIQESIDSKPLINNNELEVIEYLQNTPENSYVMSTSSIYSPWIIGYSNRKTIAPGLFDYNLHNEQEWNIFWTTNNLEEIKKFMNLYEKPLFIFIGEKQKDNLNYPECFKKYYEKESNKIYEYIC